MNLILSIIAYIMCVPLYLRYPEILLNGGLVWHISYITYLQLSTRFRSMIGRMQGFGTPLVSMPHAYLLGVMNSFSAREGR